MTKNKAKLTPMLQQYMEFKDQHPDKVLLFRMGDFYETFFDDAITASKILGITLTSRDRKKDNAVPLAGFPHHALKNYLHKLVKAGQKVVICEQVEDPKQAKGIVKRDIVDIVTPGAIIDDQFLEGSNDNFLIALYRDKKGLTGLAGIDISTGKFMFTELNQGQIKDEILRLKPVEIIILVHEFSEEIKSFSPEIEAIPITVVDNLYFDINNCENSLKEFFGVENLEAFRLNEHKTGAIACSMCLEYLKSLKKNDIKHISSLNYYSLDDFLIVDEISRRNLELVRSIRTGSKEGTLLSVMDKTRTPMGSRLLMERIKYPHLDINVIQHRLNAVSECKEKIHITEDIRLILDKIGDLSRIISKIGTLKANPRDLIALSTYLRTSPELKYLLEEFENPLFMYLSNNLENYSEVTDLIERAILENPPLTITDGNIISDGYNDELDELRSISREGKGWIAGLQKKEKEITGIPSLKIGYNKVFGYYLEVTKTHKDKIPDHYIRKQTLVNSERYISPELKEYESKVLGAEERIKNIEYELFTELRQAVYDKLEWIQKYVQIIAETDYIANLGYIAYHFNYCRPEFSTEGILELKDCRHPVIETLLKEEEFIPNDAELNSSKSLIALITGPNMAGKSTYLRQIGLIAIMAQMGSFVPASTAVLPIFDQVFTRVGASDNLAQGQSTFLVEMLETANILHNATEKSLVLLDEVGRGTSTFDGLSLAWAIVEHISSRNKSKTLFATHYHELTELENVLMNVKNFNVSVKEWNDKMIFMRKIEKGGADQSYGIQVARLAGVPLKVINRAKQILRNLEEHELSPQGLTAQLKKQLSGKSPQRDIFEVFIEKSEEKNEVLDELAEIDVNSITPMEALQKLVELQKKL